MLLIFRPNLKLAVLIEVVLIKKKACTSSLEMFTELSTAILVKECYLLVIPKYLNNDFIAFAHSKSHPYLTDKPYFHKTTLRLKLLERILNYPFLLVMIAF